ncbi:MAG TPA: hypothetical protein VLB49_11725 [Gemmatimonadales bacterium]|nr:hypothetical protein [Gemmatimonadales bacterium]
MLWAVVAGWAQGAPAAPVWTVLSAATQVTVGDTVWIERRFALPGGWRLRPGRLASDDEVEALADPVVLRDGAEWVVRYPLAAWSPGPHSVTLPPIWRLGPDAQADSVSGGMASFVLASVIPDSLKRPEPRPALAPLRAEARDARLPALALLLAAAALVGGIRWRRRPPRAVPAPDAPAPGAAIPDRRWLEAGEPKAVAARAAGRLRTAIARLVPDAHLGLPTSECLALVQGRRPQAPVAELRTVLGALDEVAFAVAPGVDVVALARLAETLAERLGR